MWECATVLRETYFGLERRLRDLHLSEDNTESEFLEAGVGFEITVREAGEERASKLWPVFEELNLTITNLDIGLGIHQFN